MAVGVAVLAVGGYLAWAFLRPDPYAVSERVVRDARRALAYEVREFQRGLDDVVRDARGRQASVDTAVDDAAAQARKDLDAVVAEAREKLADLDVELRTQRNRLDRIETRAQEAREMITEFADETKAKARGT